MSLRYFVALAVATLLSGCAVQIPQSVRDGYELPTTLEMCHSLYVDANDSIYNKDLEIKQLQTEIEELKKSKK